MTPISTSRFYGDKKRNQGPARIGDYHIREKLGEGGMGCVYRVEDPDTGQIYAVKILKPRVSGNRSEKRFKREFRALKSLDHASIVRVETLNTDVSGSWILMEYVPGISFKKMIQRDCQPERSWINRVWEWVRETCSALDYIHRRRMVHRDLKPSNIMILPEDGPVLTKLLDFGLILTDEHMSASEESRAVVGSMIYMSPEQITGEIIDIRSDLYSLGIMIYEAMTGKPPFISRDPVTMMGLHQLREPESPRKLNPALSIDEEALILRLLAKQPQDRFPSARETSERIKELLLAEMPVSDSEIPMIAWTGNLLEPAWIGNRETYDSVRKLILDVRQGGIQVGLIRGEAGIGKSRFIQELKKSPELRNQPFAQGGFMDGDVLYGGIIRAVEKAIREYRHRSGEPVLSDLQWDYETIFFKSGEILESAVKTLNIMRKISGAGPVVLFLDDLHLAGESDIRFLTGMIQAAMLDHDTGFLLLGSYRSDEIHENHPLWMWENNPAAGLPVTCLNLSRLTPEKNRILVTSCLGHSVDRELSDHIYRDSEGVPFFTIEMIRKYVDDGAVVFRDSQWTANEEVRVKLPEKISRMIGYRLSRFSREERKLLEMAAVLGKIFHAGEHEQLTGQDEDSYLDGLDAVLRHRIISEIPGDPDHYRFTHDKIRETLLTEMSRKRCQVYHRKTAETLESIYTDTAEEVSERLAVHYECGGVYDRAYHYRLAASERALRSGAQREAYEHLQAAFEYIDRNRLKTPVSIRDRIRLQLDRGRLARRMSEMELAGQLLNWVLEESEQRKFPDLAAEAKLHLGSVMSVLGDIETARSLLLSAVEWFRQQGDEGMMVDCLTNLGCVESLASNHGVSLEFHHQALELAEKGTDLKRLCRTHLNMAYACMNLSMETDALKYFQKSLSYARKQKDRRFITFNLIGIAGLYVLRGLNRETAARVLKVTDEALTDLTRTGDRMRVGEVLIKRAQALNILGLPFEDEMQRAFNIAQDFGITWLVDAIEEWRSDLSEDSKKSR